MSIARCGFCAICYRFEITRLPGTAFSTDSSAFSPRHYSQASRSGLVCGRWLNKFLVSPLETRVAFFSGLLEDGNLEWAGHKKGQCHCLLIFSKHFFSCSHSIQIKCFPLLDALLENEAYFFPHRFPPTAQRPHCKGRAKSASQRVRRASGML